MITYLITYLINPRLLDRNLKAIATRMDKLEIDLTALTQSIGAIHEIIVLLKDRLEVQEYR